MNTEFVRLRPLILLLVETKAHLHSYGTHMWVGIAVPDVEEKFTTGVYWANYSSEKYSSKDILHYHEILEGLSSLEMVDLNFSLGIFNEHFTCNPSIDYDVYNLTYNNVKFNTANRCSELILQPLQEIRASSAIPSQLRWIGFSGKNASVLK
jgi:hypothetical protein